MRKRILGVILGAAMIVGAAAGLIQKQTLQEGPPICPPSICPLAN